MALGWSIERSGWDSHPLSGLGFRKFSAFYGTRRRQKSKFFASLDLCISL
jgi:hypothetical protein